MKKLLAGMGMLLLFTAPIMAQDQKQATAAPAPKAMKAAKKSANDEKGVEKAFEGVSAAWASGDAAQMMKFFTGDSSLINPMGQEGWGRAEVEKIVAADLEHFK